MHEIPKIKFKKLDPRAIIPRRWTPGAIGLDLHAFILTEYGRPSKSLIPPHTTVNIGTGLLVEPPKDTFLFVCPRSGLGKHSISIANSPGTIDPDYRGEIRVLVYNGGYENFWVEHEMRIAQLIALPVFEVTTLEVQELTHSLRGDRGFGSTGV